VDALILLACYLVVELGFW